MSHKMHPSLAFMTVRAAVRFLSAGYLAHLPPSSCGAKRLRAREKEKRKERERKQESWPRGSIARVADESWGGKRGCALATWATNIDLRRHWLSSFHFRDFNLLANLPPNAKIAIAMYVWYLERYIYARANNLNRRNYCKW